MLNWGNTIPVFILIIYCHLLEPLRCTLVCQYIFFPSIKVDRVTKFYNLSNVLILQECISYWTPLESKSHRYIKSNQRLKQLNFLTDFGKKINRKIKRERLVVFNLAYHPGYYNTCTKYNSFCFISLKGVKRLSWSLISSAFICA